jgi:glycosyltransferase involved in cell wall biosynthesis
MKILHVVLNLKKGGLEHLVANLAKKQEQAGHEVKICSLEAEPEHNQLIRNQNVHAVFLNRVAGKDWRLLWQIIKVIRKESPDIVHAHNTTPLIYCGLAGKIAKGPRYINTRHGDFVKHWPDILLKSYDCIVAVSHASMATLIKHNNIRSVKVIHNGIDTSFYADRRDGNWENTYKNNINISRSQKVVGIIARLSKEKDHETLIRAFDSLQHKVNNALLLIIGDGPEKEKLLDISADLRAQNKVKFLDFRNDIPELLNILDLLVLSSFSEGLSITLLEAMASRLPVVATNVGGNPEVVVDGETGILVPPKDPQKMAEAIIEILQNPGLAKKMGEAGRKRVEDEFSLDRMAREYELIYENCRAKR